MEEKNEIYVSSSEAEGLTLMTAAELATNETEQTTAAESETNTVFEGESGTIGSFGSYRVDPFSGMLSMEFKDFAWEGSRMPVSITHSYNGAYRDKNYGFWRKNNGNFGGMTVGQGWRLNLMQSMVRKDNTYVYTDEADEELIFKPCTCESGTCEDCSLFEDEKDRGYTFDASTGILKKGEEKHRFIGGKLRQIEDAHGNTMSIEYNSDGHLTQVIDGVGRCFVFGYDGDRLASITAPNGAQIRYTYTDCGLSGIHYPNGQQITFGCACDSEYELSVTVSGASEDAALMFGYEDSAGRVGSIRRYYGDTCAQTNAGVTTEFRYYADGKQTVITDTERAGADQEDKEIKRYRVFYSDYPQSNYTYYESSEEDKISLSSDKGEFLPYTEPGIGTGNLRSTNFLVNHNFRYGSGVDLDMSGWSTNMNGYGRFVSADDNRNMPGFCSVYTRTWNEEDRARGFWQEHALVNGDYTLSCYMRLASNVKNAEHGAYLMVTFPNGTTKKTPLLQERKSEFVRAVLPFTVSKNESCIRVGIYVDGKVAVRLIAPQLALGKRLPPYNYISGEPKEFIVEGCPEKTNEQVLATVKVNSAAGTRETFTLSTYVMGNMTSTSDTQQAEAGLKAKVYYYSSFRAGEERELVPDEFSLPIYSAPGFNHFNMIQFAKRQYRGVERIEIIAENNYNASNLMFYQLQLIRNKVETGLTAEDFADTADDEIAYGADEAVVNASDSDGADTESILFEEVKDAYGNALTGTNFRNGEFGAVYMSYRFDQTCDDLADEGNNKTEESDARGNKTLYEYDSLTSKPTAVTDRCGNRTEYGYDESGRTRSVNAPNGGSVLYDYNAMDDLTGITRGDGQRYGMSYDAYRNLTKVSVDGQTLVDYTYKPATGRLKTMTYANGATQKLNYDAKGNLVSETWTNGSTTEAKYRYSYDSDQNLVKTLDILGGKQYNINRKGDNVTSIEEYNVTVSDDLTVSNMELVGTMQYSFDTDGKQFRKKYVSANGGEQKYVFEYRDEQNVAVQLPTGAVSHAKTDHLGRKVFDEIQLGKGLLNRKFSYYEGVISQAHIDGEKQVSAPETTLVKTIDFADGRQLAYEYDREERITKVTDTVGGVETVTEYTYDEMGQLLTETVNGNLVNSMTYDRYGNILTKNGVQYGYDDCCWKDRLTSYDGYTIPYDANGNPTQYCGTPLTWEKGRQLASYASLYQYEYNHEGIRISKNVDGVKHTYTLDGTNIVKETWDGNIMVPLYGVDGSVVGIRLNGTAYYFYKNLQGDVLAITDEAGNTLAQYSYDAWGKCTIVEDLTEEAEIDIATINPFRYRGYYYDEETEWYYLQSRYYDPELGRFINADEAVMAMTMENILSPNLYNYCQNCVTNYKDDNGYLRIPTWLLSAGLDVLFIALNAAMCAGYIGLSSTIYVLARSPFTRKAAQNLLTKKVVPCFIYGMLNPIMTAIRTVLWRIGGAIAMGISNYLTVVFQNVVNRFLTLIQQRFLAILSSILTWVGIITLLLDIADGSWDDYVTV